MEGGGFYTDGEGTVLTTEGPVLGPARNGAASRRMFEQIAREYLGADKVLWLVAFPDRDTDGHVDGIAQFAGPAQLLLLVPAAPGHANYAFARENIPRLAAATAARARPVDVIRLQATASARIGGG